MATNKEIFETAVDDVIKTIGHLATYTPKVGNPVVGCSIELIADSDDKPEGLIAQFIDADLSIEYLLSEIPHEASLGDKFTLSEDDLTYTGATYVVSGLVERTAETVIVAVKVESLAS